MRAISIQRLTRYFDTHRQIDIMLVLCKNNDKLVIAVLYENSIKRDFLAKINIFPIIFSLHTHQ